MEYKAKHDRPATIICSIGSRSSPPSDIGDWGNIDESTLENSEDHGAGAWRGHTLRRVCSWVTGTPYRLPALPNWLGDIGSYMATARGLRRTSARCQSMDSKEANDSSHISQRSCSHCGCCSNDVVVVCEHNTDAADKLPITEPTIAKETKLEIHSRDSLTIRELQAGFDEKQTHLCVTTKDKNTNTKRVLMSVFQIPDYMIEDYIWDSYRPICCSYRECLKSWGYVHSELGNIMTHLFGVVIFIVLALLTGPVVIPDVVDTRKDGTYITATAPDYLVVYTYICTVLFCFAASVAFHTLSCHSQRKHFRSLRCDFIGILTLIVGSFVPVGYYGFVHSRKILIGYMVMFVAVGVAGVLVSIIGRVEDPKRAFLRPVVFMTIAAAGIAPLIHAAVLNGYAGAVDRLSLWYVVTMIALYIVGTLIYAFKIPERYRPGKHNVLLHSHQIFHVFVVLAAVCHYVGIIRALRWVHEASSQ
ncbi:hypothetical protein GGI25_000248 [Coemansia spiralis]|uniref:Uncharacterized protein n=2 Tax=Coemansia TaxID=4863 RepID=A0A9W8G8I7_9FUNG|nr:hemolysin-III related-domain-containing protein [Coemansia spiralis]KAJ1995875.1 hypothetical protein EDC05_000535 [Coemansia umbellata]KAJ2625822.1 hypothetical protein GGI26_000283 [Coemansia sp. RSA 1358]KAJ2680944.1 hypothetical protein GGI25_000248 [Coemansia spiralis]